MTLPDPSIAPLVDPDQPPDEQAVEPPARWVRFDGPEAQSVINVGRWEPGAVRPVVAWMAGRLLQHPHFTEADAPDDQPTDGPAGVKAWKRRTAEPAIEAAPADTP